MDLGADRFIAAEQHFTAAIAGWQSAGQHALAAQGCNYLGQIRRAQGNLDTTMNAYQELLRITALPAGGTSPVAGIGHVGIAEVAYQRGDLAAARRELQTGLPLCRQLSDTQVLATGLATLAWIRQAEGDPAGARQAMDEAERMGPSPAAAALLNPVPAQRARLAPAHGDIAAAARSRRHAQGPRCRTTCATMSPWLSERSVRSPCLRLEAGRRALAEWERENGPLTEAELAEGRARARSSLGRTSGDAAEPKSA